MRGQRPSDPRPVAGPFGTRLIASSAIAVLPFAIYAERAFQCASPKERKMTLQVPAIHQTHRSQSIRSTQRTRRGSSLSRDLSLPCMWTRNSYCGGAYTSTTEPPSAPTWHGTYSVETNGLSRIDAAMTDSYEYRAHPSLLGDGCRQRP